MFNIENKPANLKTLYGEHKNSASNIESNATRFQKEIYANYTTDLTRAKKGFIYESI